MRRLAERCSPAASAWLRARPGPERVAAAGRWPFAASAQAWRPADGRAALSEADRFRPDLVLLDITLPELDGFQVCEQLRAEHSSGMGIIMLTARGREAEVAKGLALGADAYVTKPFSTRDLVDTVHKLLGTPRCSGG